MFSSVMGEAREQPGQDVKGVAKCYPTMPEHLGLPLLENMSTAVSDIMHSRNFHRFSVMGYTARNSSRLPPSQVPFSIAFNDSASSIEGPSGLFICNWTSSTGNLPSGYFFRRTWTEDMRQDYRNAPMLQRARFSTTTIEWALSGVSTTLSGNDATRLLPFFLAFCEPYAPGVLTVAGSFTVKISLRANIISIERSVVIIVLPSMLIVTDVEDVLKLQDLNPLGIAVEHDDDNGAIELTFDTAQAACNSWAESRSLPLNGYLFERLFQRMHSAYESTGGGLSTWREVSSEVFPHNAP